MERRVVRGLSGQPAQAMGIWGAGGDGSLLAHQGALIAPPAQWGWSAVSAPWPRRSGPRAPAVATPPSPSGSSRDGRGRLRRSAGTVGCNRFRSSSRSGPATGSGRQDGQGDARAAHRLAILEFRMRGSVTWFACTAWNVSLRTHNFPPDARARPGKTPVRTARSPRLLIRMRPPVQVQPGPQISP